MFLHYELFYTMYIHSGYTYINYYIACTWRKYRVLSYSKISGVTNIHQFTMIPSYVQLNTGQLTNQPKITHHFPILWGKKIPLPRVVNFVCVSCPVLVIYTDHTRPVGWLTLPINHYTKEQGLILDSNIVSKFPSPPKRSDFYHTGMP